MYFLLYNGYNNAKNTKDIHLYDTLCPSNEYLLLGRYIMIDQNCVRANKTGCIYSIVLLDRNIFVYEHRYGFNCVIESNVNKKGILKIYVGTITPKDYSVIIRSLISLLPSEYLNFLLYADTFFTVKYVNYKALTSHACGYRITYIPIEGLPGNNVYKIYIHEYADKKEWNSALIILNNYLPEEYQLPLLKNKN